MSRPFRPFDPFERGGPFEGARELKIPRPPRRFWVGVAFFGLALLVFFLVSPAVYFATESQWYSALGIGDIFTTRVGLQAELFGAAFVIALVFAVFNAVLAL